MDIIYQGHTWRRVGWWDLSVPSTGVRGGQVWVNPSARQGITHLLLPQVPLRPRKRRKGSGVPR